MKFVLTTLFLVSGLVGFTQVNIGPQFNVERTREAIFFIEDLSTVDDAATLKKYLEKFEGKIEMVNIDLSTQMCILEVLSIDNQNLEELIFQAGFKGFPKTELPPVGFKYVYNPDGTWKLKEL